MTMKTNSETLCNFRVRVKLTFPDSLVRKPVLAHLIREFDVTPDIRRANVFESQGLIVCEIDGERSNVNNALVWLEEQDIAVDFLDSSIEG